MSDSQESVATRSRLQIAGSVGRQRANPKHADPFLVDSIIGVGRGQTRNLLCGSASERFDR